MRAALEGEDRPARRRFRGGILGRRWSGALRRLGEKEGHAQGERGNNQGPDAENPPHPVPPCVLSFRLTHGLRWYAGVAEVCARLLSPAYSQCW